TGNDVITGDNAVVWRRFDPLSPRFITLSAAAIYDTTGAINSNLTPQNDPTGALHREITQLDHSNSPLPGTHGDDILAGGSGDDELFGELGNDIIQGDGSIALNPDGSIANPVGAVRQADGTLVVMPAAEAASDGMDYIEGGGGDDVIFGGL